MLISAQSWTRHTVAYRGCNAAFNSRIGSVE
jgi:hypothetical protein